MRKNKIIIIVLLLAAALLGGLLWFRFTPRPAPPAPSEEPVVTAEPTPEPTPTPPPTPEPTPEYFTISMVGDCTLAPSQYNNHFNEMLKGDMAHPFSGTAEYFKNDYLTIANLECSFSDRDIQGHTTFWFVSPSSYTEILTAGSVEFVTRANNHTDDFDDEAPLDTAAALDAAGVAHAGPDDYAVYQSGDGLKIGLYAARWMSDEAEVVSGIKRMREENPDLDLAVACMHWGIEGSYKLTDGQLSIGRAAIDAGADFVYGSHPHVLQQVDEYGGGYIINSLGNWSFGGNTSPRDRDTAIIQITVKRDVDGSISLEGWNAIPCCLSSTPAINDYRPVPYEPGTEEYDRAMSKLLGTFTGPDLSIDYSVYHQNGTLALDPSGQPADGGGETETAAGVETGGEPQP